MPMKDAYLRQNINYGIELTCELELFEN